MATTFRDAYRAERSISANGHRPKRDPLLIVAGRLIGRYAPRWRQARTAVMQTSASIGMTWAAWATDPRLGAVTGSVCLLVLEALGGDRR